MDFKDTPEEAAYRAKARAWLAAHAPRHGFPLDSHAPDYLARAKAWQAEKAAAGYACITWLKEWGGPGGSPMEAVIYAEEEAPYQPPIHVFTIGLGICLPAVMTVGDEAAKVRFGAPALRGEEIWCQLFSEPGGGSDVAAARTRAVQASDDSGDWILNGQKVWTSGAQFADYGLIVTRTDPDVPKHQGMTMFWLDMRSPGIEVRPIHEMTDAAQFNEVFLTDVRVRDSQRVGPVSGGWKASLVTLMNERLAVSGLRPPAWPTMLHVARAIPGALQDQALREKIADWYVLGEGLRHTRNRTMTALSRGETPGPESSIGKVVLANYFQDLAVQALEMMDQYGVIADPDLMPAHGVLHANFLSMPGMRIAGGTDEILRNIIAERVLGLPGDIRVDKDVPFKDMPTGR